MMKGEVWIAENVNRAEDSLPHACKKVEMTLEVTECLQAVGLGSKRLARKGE